MAMSPELVWECVKSSSAFIRKSRNLPALSAEPGNICGVNSLKHSGLANKQVLDVSRKLRGRKEAIVMTLKPSKPSRAAKPCTMYQKMGLAKGKKGPASLMQVAATHRCRRDVVELALQKYAKIKQSMKARKLTKKIRRA
eukprot:TRINITY_DN82756_c0_g1_i1.p1 TRINITY_DN82756_c0_g1~~TRINITY_DN82756_c0_g1_i1.p1  ORF type:complete len:140 (+),score=38.66 TRINITY_DN82756_c0_g1_i1:53-472(+)